MYAGLPMDFFIYAFNKVCGCATLPPVRTARLPVMVGVINKMDVNKYC
jgi:hypothetical protein